jgi:hypothetical protein
MSAWGSLSSGYEHYLSSGTVEFKLYCPRTPRCNLSSTLRPQMCWCLIQVIHSLRCTSKINYTNYIKNNILNNNSIYKLIKVQRYFSKAKLYERERERNYAPKWNVLTSRSPVANLYKALILQCLTRNHIFLGLYISRKMFSLTARLSEVEDHCSMI